MKKLISLTSSKKVTLYTMRRKHSMMTGLLKLRPILSTGTWTVSDLPTHVQKKMGGTHEEGHRTLLGGGVRAWHAKGP